MNGRIIYSLAVLFAVTACGNTASDRSLSGAGIGAGAGAVGAALMHGNVVTGAALGAAAGAITGAATEKEQLDLGKPIWRK